MSRPCQPEHPGDPRLPTERWVEACTKLRKMLQFAGDRITCIRTRKVNSTGAGQAFAVLVVARPHPAVAKEYRKKLKVQNISGLVTDVTGQKWLDEGAVSASSPYTIKDMIEKRLGITIKVEPDDS